MPTYGAFEARNKLGHLLDLVEQGEEVTITRHGRAVARLVPVALPVNRDIARAAIQRLRERAAGLRSGAFDWQEWKAFRDTGQN